MKKRTKNLIQFILMILIGFGGYTAYESFSGDTIKIANWNLQIFGESKASDLSLMQFYINKINNYDIIFVQEIRDSSGTAFPKLCSVLQNYSCLSSSRAGRSGSKEQYGLIYKKGINITSFTDYNPDSQDRWERPPINVLINSNGYSFRVYNIHTKPEDVQAELKNLENLVDDYGNVIILGDLNADCSYYNNGKQSEFDSWNWIISDSDDTTTAKSSCAYDRIILNSDAKQEFVSYGIDKQEITDAVSDHYLVWFELKI